MPLYTFKNKNTGEISKEFFSYEKKLQYLKNNPDIESVLECPSYVSDRIIATNSKHIPVDFKSKLKQIKKDYPKANFDAR